MFDLTGKDVDRRAERQRTSQRFGQVDGHKAELAQPQHYLYAHESLPVSISHPVMSNETKLLSLKMRPKPQPQGQCQDRCQKDKEMIEAEPNCSRLRTGPR